MPWKSVAFWQGRWPGYVLAVLFVAAAAGLRDSIAGIIGAKGPFLLFFPAILAAAGVGGLGPAILAVSLSAVLGWTFANATGPEALAHLVVFLVSGFGVVALAGLLTRWRNRAAESV